MNEYKVLYRIKGDWETLETITWGDSIEEVAKHSEIDLEGYEVISISLVE